MNEELTREDIASHIDHAVEELLAAADLRGPAVDAIALAQAHLGMIVSVDRGEQRSRTQRGQDRHHILLRPEQSTESQQWTTAHAIGEFLKPDLLTRLGLAPEQSRAFRGESLANQFAQRLLVPTFWLVDEVRACDHDLLELKQRFRTASHEVVASRLLDLPDPCIITIIDNDHIHRRRSNAWRVRKELAGPEREVQRYVSQYSRPQSVREAGWNVQGWPIHQIDWKREILRSVVDDEEALALAFGKRRLEEN
jgi:Zn-dependent peptidase ImmA (M78 family)